MAIDEGKAMLCLAVTLPCSGRELIWTAFGGSEDSSICEGRVDVGRRLIELQDVVLGATAPNGAT